MKEKRKEKITCDLPLQFNQNIQKKHRDEKIIDNYRSYTKKRKDISRFKKKKKTLVMLYK